MAALTKWRAPEFLRPFGWEESGLDEFFEGFGEPRWWGMRPRWMEVQFPRIETYERDGNYVVKADLPGVDPKDVHITVEGNRLILRGERKEDKEVRRRDFHRREVYYGSFERSIPMPQGLKTDGLKAKYHNGILEIKAPYEKGHLAKKVEVQIEKTA